MTITRNSWHYKVFAWFKGYEPQTFNLCPYVRTVFLWAPLKFLFAKGFIKKVPVAAITWPVLLIELPRWAGVFSYNLKCGLLMIYGIAGLVAVATGLAALLAWIFSREGLGFGQVLGHTAAAPFRAVSESSTWSLIKAYFKAAHDKVCPFITFRDGQ